MESSLYDEYVRIEDTHWWFRGRRKIITALLRPYLRPPARIIDVGSGGGAVAQALQEFGHVTACDIDVRCAASVARRPGMSFAYGTAEAIPFADGSFDLVTAFDVLEHLDDDVRALREMARVVSPAGLIAVTVPAYGWLSPPGTNRRSFPAPWIRRGNPSGPGRFRSTGAWFRRAPTTGSYTRLRSARPSPCGRETNARPRRPEFRLLHDEARTLERPAGGHLQCRSSRAAGTRPPGRCLPPCNR